MEIYKKLEVFGKTSKHEGFFRITLWYMKWERGVFEMEVLWYMKRERGVFEMEVLYFFDPIWNDNKMQSSE